MSSKNPFSIDSKEPNWENFHDFLLGEVRYLSVKKAGTTGKSMHDRLKAQGLIHKRLFRHYDQLHTQSLEWVVDDTLMTLNNWEREQATSSARKQSTAT